MEYVADTATKLFDRADPTVKARQDLAIHAVLFVGAIWVIQKFGHKLAV